MDQQIGTLRILWRVEGFANSIQVITNGEMAFNSNLKVHYTSFSIKRLKNWWSTPREIRKVIREFQPDIIHIHNLYQIGR